MPYSSGPWQGAQALLTDAHAQHMWRAIQERRLEAVTISIDYTFRLSNRLQASRLVDFLRETSESRVEVVDVTTLGDSADSFEVSGTIYPTVVSLEFLQGLFRWLRQAEQRQGAHVMALSL